MEPTLVASALAASLASGLFLAAALNLRRPAGDPEGRRAVEAFSLWWLGLAAYALASASQDMVAALGTQPLALLVTLRYVQMASVCIGLWGLVYYVGYVLTGERRLMVPLALAYGAYYAVLVFLATRGLWADAAAWRGGPAGAEARLGAVGLGLLLAIPPLVAVAGYLLLYARARGRGQRLRMLLVAFSTFAWSASMLAREAAWTALVPALLGVVSAWSVSWAARPPPWLEEQAKWVEAL